MLKIRKSTLSKILSCVMLAALCLFAGASRTYCQQMPNSTQTQQETDEARRLRVVEALERAQDEVRASRKYIAGLETSVNSKQSIIDAQAKRQTLADEAISSLQKEVEILQKAVASQKETIAIQETQAKYLKSELDKTNKKLKRARSINKYLIVGAAALILATIFK